MFTLANIIKISLMFVKKFQNNIVFFFSGYPLLIRAMSGLIVVKNDSALLFAPEIFNDSAPMAE